MDDFSAPFLSTMFTSFFAVIFAGAARIIETSSAFTTTGTAFLWFPEKEKLLAFCTVTFFMVPLFLIAKKDVNIVLKKGAEKSSITCTKNAQAQVDNQTKKAISVKIADGTTLKVESGESCTITPKGKKEDTSGEDKTDGKDQKTDDTSDGNASSGSSSSGNSSGGTTVETPSKLTEADLLKQGYQLKWQDNFDGNFLNRADWNVELHEKGWVNSEWQEYVDSDKNIQVKDGKLLIKPVETVNADGTRSYTYGRINTQGKHDFKYGYFECRAKVPTGKGYLPAFWMMPTDENLYGQWPKCGEIDIMEVMGQETNKAYGTIHYGEPHDQSQGTCTVDAKNNFADQYHTYACDWEPGKITWYIDGVKFHIIHCKLLIGIGGRIIRIPYPAATDRQIQNHIKRLIKRCRISHFSLPALCSGLCESISERQL